MNFTIRRNAAKEEEAINACYRRALAVRRNRLIRCLSMSFGKPTAMNDCDLMVLESRKPSVTHRQHAAFYERRCAELLHNDYLSNFVAAP